MLNAARLSRFASTSAKAHPSWGGDLLKYPRFSLLSGRVGRDCDKGIAGFGADHHMHSANIVEISDHLPLKIEFIESREKVDELLGKLDELAGTGMIEIQETSVAKPPRSRSRRSHASAHVKMEGKAKMMRIYIGESDRWKDKPLYSALVEAMRANDIAALLSIAASRLWRHRRVHKDKA